MPSAQFDMTTILKELAPENVLRVAVNCGNIVLVQADPNSNELVRGVVPALAGELAMRLGVPLQLVRYRNAGAVFSSIGLNAWDVCFLAIDPVRAAEIAFTEPYVLIEGTYLVALSSAHQTAADVDVRGVRIAVSAKSAYDLFLTRSLLHAELVRCDSFKGAVTLFREGKVDALAGVRQPLDLVAAEDPQVRVLTDRFMVINQASGTLPGRPAGYAYLNAFIEDMKASGFVARALAESGQSGASVAPLGVYPTFGI